MNLEVWQAVLPFPASVLDLLSESLSTAERERATRSAVADVGIRFRSGRGLVRHLLGRRLGVPPESLVIDVEEGGRPRLRGPEPCLFSVSHSRDCLVIAIADTGRLGVDVEHSRPDTDIAAIVRRFFRPDEREAWDHLDEGSRTAAFLRLWTRKEAILKALGLGLTGLDRLSIDPGEALSHPVRWLAGEPDAPERWWCHSWSPAPGVLATLAATACPTEVSPRSWNPAQTGLS
ncbi:MAG TPA: 4'-phosphopantetheinyl transferase superfamily protein [Candidatus Ozemobacteraceae bacterium]|nr:4'-phosphopantetheinyl transferase superfamily protein [Candidatus Ozemobacteraceae bacterium]